MDLYDLFDRWIGERGSYFATKSTFEPTGTPECKQSQAKYGPAWFGPYMGFQHVELCVLGHLHRTRKLEDPELYTQANGPGRATQLGAELERLKRELERTLEDWSSAGEALDALNAGAS